VSEREVGQAKKKEMGDGRREMGREREEGKMLTFS